MIAIRKNDWCHRLHTAKLRHFFLSSRAKGSHVLSGRFCTSVRPLRIVLFAALRKESPPPTPEDMPEELKNKSVRELNLLALSGNSYASEDDDDDEEEKEEEEEEDHSDQQQLQGVEGDAINLKHAGGARNIFGKIILH